MTVVIDQFTPYLKKLSQRNLRRLQRDIAVSLQTNMQERQREQRDIHGNALAPRDTEYWAANPYQEHRRHMPLFPHLMRNVRAEFSGDRLRVGFTGRAGELAALNNTGRDAPKREVVGFSRADLQAVADHIQLQLSA